MPAGVFVPSRRKGNGCLFPEMHGIKGVYTETKTAPVPSRCCFLLPPHAAERTYGMQKLTETGKNGKRKLNRKEAARRAVIWFIVAAVAVTTLGISLIPMF